MSPRKPTVPGTGGSGKAVAAQDGSHRFPIVGIGASAGGLEAATNLFKQLSPHLAIAYVVVLHAGTASKKQHARGEGPRLRHSPEL
jgi:chemotaxis response regulator CheB